VRVALCRGGLHRRRIVVRQRTFARTGTLFLECDVA
jgi:hypothetical protein